MSEAFSTAVKEAVADPSQGPMLYPIGSVGATWYVHNGVDVMRVHMADNRASNLIFDQEAFEVSSAVSPTVNMPVCASLGNSDAIDCGTVTDPYVSYILEGRTVWGGDHDGIAIQGGDSGSPIYVRHDEGPVLYSWAVGILSSFSGKFARVTQALAHWNSTIFVP